MMLVAIFPIAMFSAMLAFLIFTIRKKEPRKFIGLWVTAGLLVAAIGLILIFVFGRDDGNSRWLFYVCPPLTSLLFYSLDSDRPHPPSLYLVLILIFFESALFYGVVGCMAYHIRGMFQRLRGKDASA